METAFISFLEKLPSSLLVESIKSGYMAVFESPDAVYVNGRESAPIEYTDSDAYPFTYYTTNGRKNGNRAVVIGDPAHSHSGRDKTREVVGTDLSRKIGEADGKVLVTGRFWLNSKVISLWLTPDKEEFFDIVDKLKASDVPIDSSWKVEICNDPFYDKHSVTSPFIVPISEYMPYNDKMKEQMAKEHELHLMNGNEKKEALIGKGVLPKKLDVDMSEAEYRSKVNQE